MKTYTYTEARKNFATVLDEALSDGEVLIRRRSGEVFTIRPRDEDVVSDPFAHVPGIETTGITNEMVCDAIREGRDRDYSIDPDQIGKGR